jgi:phosphohistidine phosphatase
MELILWRHADAEDADGKDDAARELTKKGRKQAERMAKWLRPRLEGDWRILVSPAKRALQTVKPLDLAFEENEAIGTGTSPAALLRAAGWTSGEGQVLVVGHQPTLGEVAAQILGTEDDLAIRKGAIWWFVARGSGDNMEVVLRAALSPDLLDD